jgi:catechol 2,3-dioxygenase-like lactoylglutathione lyase family enzyme
VALRRLALLLLTAGAGCTPAPGESRHGEPDVEVRRDRGRDDFGVVIVRGIDPRHPPAVTVRAGTDPDAPPLAGTIHVAGDSLSFVPRFRPGDIGALRVTVDGVLHSFAITAPGDPAPSAELVAVHPSAPTIPANQLRWYLEFSAPMREGEAARNVHLVDSAGREVPGAFLAVEEELWDPSRRRLTLLFDMGRVKRGLRTREEAGAPLEPGKTYSLVVDAAWRDARGAPLRTGGHHRFRAVAPDLRGPDPSQWQISPPVSGCTEPLTVSLDGTIDRAMGLTLIGVWRDGVRVEGAPSLSGDGRRWSFVPVEPWTAGAHELRVSRALEDASGNSVARPFEVPADAPGGAPSAEWVTRPFAAIEASPATPAIPVLAVAGAAFALSVADLEASAAWYEAKLGLSVVMRAPRTDETRSSVVVLQGSGLTIELVRHDDARPVGTIASPTRDALAVHGIFKVGVTVDDFDAALAALRGRGVEIAMGPWPKRADQPANVIIRDNAGNLIQIFGK